MAFIGLNAVFGDFMDVRESYARVKLAIERAQAWHFSILREGAGASHDLIASAALKIMAIMILRSRALSLRNLLPLFGLRISLFEFLRTELWVNN